MIPTSHTDIHGKRYNYHDVGAPQSAQILLDIYGGCVTSSKFKLNFLLTHILTLDKHNNMGLGGLVSVSTSPLSLTVTHDTRGGDQGPGARVDIRDHGHHCPASGATEDWCQVRGLGATGAKSLSCLPNIAALCTLYTVQYIPHTHTTHTKHTLVVNRVIRQANFPGLHLIIPWV